MDASRTMKLHAIQERIERGEYEIDAGEVAEAIVTRLAR
jgi:anti-sigma28 factor (negative regulator of flagellin synthesis)